MKDEKIKNKNKIKMKKEPTTVFFVSNDIMKHISIRRNLRLLVLSIRPKQTSQVP
jgi:hypothetical protein